MISRRITGILLLLVAVVPLLALAYLALNTLRNPEPVRFESTEEGVQIRFNVALTRTIFNGDCIGLEWGIDGAREIFVNDAAVTPAGERAHCDGTPPKLYIIAANETVLVREFPRWVLFDQWDTWTLVVSAVLFVLAGGWILGVHRWKVPASDRPIVQYGLALGFAIVWVFALDLFTNSLNIYKFTWDHYHYIDMAERGIAGNPGLVAPFAYRPIPPMLAGLIGEFAGRSVLAGFRVVTYVGMISQLVLTFALARQFTRKNWVAWVVMLVIGISTYNVKFLLFDIFRPDSLAYALILIGMLAFVQRSRMAGATQPDSEADVKAQHTAPLQNVLVYDAVILGTSAFGLLVREFCILPALLLGFRLLRELIKTRRIFSLVELAIVAGVIAAAYVLPRQMIVVGRSVQLVDVAEGGISGILFNAARDFNLVFGVVMYLLPLLVLLTVERARRLWARLSGSRVDLILYTLAVLALMMIGGTDLSRFAAYLFVPLIILLAILLDERIRLVEIVYMLAAMAIYHRVIAPVPQANLDAYLDFLVAWDDRTSTATWLRGVELLAWIGGAWVLRWSLKDYLNRQDAKIAKGEMGEV